MSNKMKLSGLTDLLKDLDVESLEGVTIEGDIELDISGGGGLNPAMAYAMGHEAAQISLHVANIARMLGYPVDQLFAASMGGLPQAPVAGASRIPELLPAKFDVSKMSEWATPIQEVTLGASSADGGSR